MDIQQITFEGAQYIIKRQTISFAEMQNKEIWGSSYEEIGIYCKEHDIEPQFPPVTFYLMWDVENQKTELAPGFRVEGVESVKKESLELFSVDKAPALKLEYHGDYAGIKAAHEAMGAYIKEHQLQSADVVFEEYVTDPGVEKDPAKWITNIYYLLKS